MSFEAMEYTLAHSEAKGSAKVLIFALARHANGQGEAWPTLATLSAYSHLSDRAVRNCLRELEALGEVHTFRRDSESGDQRANRYRLEMPACNCPRGSDQRIKHRPDPATRQEV